MINQEVYGLSENWIDAVINWNSNPNKNQLANFMNAPLSPSSTSVSVLWRAVSEGKLEYGVPIDNSLSYCGHGYESAMSHTSYIGYNEGVKILRTDDRAITNFAFFERRRRENVYIPSTTDCPPITDLLRRNRINNFAWIDTLVPGTNFCVYNSPIVKLNPKNICFLVQVQATKSLGTPSWIDFNTFASDTDYRYFYAARIVPYFSNNGTTGRNSNAGAGAPEDGEYNFFLNLLENYNIPEWNNFNSNIYSYINNIIFGNLMGGQVGYYQSNNDYINIAYLTPKAKDNLHIDDVQSSTYRIYIDRYNELAEEILKTVACFGLYFTTKSSVAINGSLTDSDMYIGILDEYGVGHGKYLRGAATAQAPQNNYTDMHQVPYDPRSADTTKYQNDTQFYAGYGTSSFTKFWALTETQVNQLSQELYRIASDVPAGTSITEYNMKVYLTNNPIDCIISLKKFPVLNIPLASTDGTIYLGAKATNITGKILATPTWVFYFNFKNTTDTSLRQHFGGSFLDYEPYTKCKIVVPFCGTVEIPVSYIYEYDDIQIALVMDFITGACTAYVLANGITIDSISGSCAIDLPVSGIQSATLDSQIHSASMAREKQQTGLAAGLIAGAVAIGVGIATGGVATALGGAAAIVGSFMKAEDTGKQINYELSHMQTPMKQITAASGQIAHTYDMRCKMIINRPKLLNGFQDNEEAQAAYANTIGYACLIHGKVDDLHGLTQASISLDDVNCTAAEKELIRNAFANGVYLPSTYSDDYWT